MSQILVMVKNGQKLGLPDIVKKYFALLGQATKPNKYQDLVKVRQRALM